MACIYMLCDVLHTVANLQGSLQSKGIDLGSVPETVQSTTKKLRELKDDASSSTWSKDNSMVFTGPVQLGVRNTAVTD